MKSGIEAPSRVNLQRPFRRGEDAKGCGQTAPLAPGESTAAPDETHVMPDELIDGVSPGADGTGWSPGAEGTGLSSAPRVGWSSPAR